ncbi:hypothetical protein SAMN05421743_1247 [Thalassobacillus cyri]|uniref:Uncharacterized protein n=1 Tax=Thalassobacillus cyri TaxID=571932 RepID=A0A1H4H974_9BACI|nr:hypothetical protein SAMN05421743_1247 [Thalassobacillus cyri]
MRDSYGIKVHGEIPQGFSPRKLTVLPWKASDFPDLQRTSTVPETVSLETESSAKESLTVKRFYRANLIKKVLSHRMTQDLAFLNYTAFGFNCTSTFPRVALEYGQTWWADCANDSASS